MDNCPTCKSAHELRWKAEQRAQAAEKRLAEAERCLCDALIRAQRNEPMSGYWVEFVTKFLRPADSAPAARDPFGNPLPKGRTAFQRYAATLPDSASPCRHEATIQDVRRTGMDWLCECGVLVTTQTVEASHVSKP